MTGYLAIQAILFALTGAPEKQAVREDLELRAFLLEGLFKTRAKPDEICYVAFDAKRDKETHRTVYTDPPAKFLERFKGRPFQVKPASAYPRPKGVPLPMNNPKTGIPDGIYTVQITAWVDENTAKIRAGMYRSGLWASGYEAVVEKRDGKWRIKQRGSAWRS